MSKKLISLVSVFSTILVSYSLFAKQIDIPLQPKSPLAQKILTQKTLAPKTLVFNDYAKQPIQQISQTFYCDNSVVLDNPDCYKTLTQQELEKADNVKNGFFFDYPRNIFDVSHVISPYKRVRTEILPSFKSGFLYIKENDLNNPITKRIYSSNYKRWFWFFDKTLIVHKNLILANRGNGQFLTFNLNNNFNKFIAKNNQNLYTYLTVNSRKQYILHNAFNQEEFYLKNGRPLKTIQLPSHKVLLKFYYPSKNTTKIFINGFGNCFVVKKYGEIVSIICNSQKINYVYKDGSYLHSVYFNDHLLTSYNYDQNLFIASVLNAENKKEYSFKINPLSRQIMSSKKPEAMTPTLYSYKKNYIKITQPNNKVVKIYKNGLFSKKCDVCWQKSVKEINYNNNKLISNETLFAKDIFVFKYYTNNSLRSVNFKTDKYKLISKYKYNQNTLKSLNFTIFNNQNKLSFSLTNIYSYRYNKKRHINTEKINQKINFYNGKKIFSNLIYIKRNSSGSITNIKYNNQILYFSRNKINQITSVYFTKNMKDCFKQLNNTDISCAPINSESPLVFKNQSKNILKKYKSDKIYLFKYIYDNNNQIQKIISNNFAGNNKNTIILKYDNRGFSHKIIKYSKFQTLTMIYKYNQNNMIKSIENLIGKKLFLYTSGLNEKGYALFNTNNIPKEFSKFVFNKNGYIEALKVYDSNGKLVKDISKKNTSNSFIKA